MSGTITPILRSEPQAANIFGGHGLSPRQRNVFMVRFGPGSAAIGSLQQLTYVIKHCDRPKIAPKTEELNQYNKKRVIYTGFKYEPIRMTFYDSADGAAQKMWALYAAYYFGDFAQGGSNGYGYDVTTQPMISGGYGLSEPYLGNTDPASQWFFNHIIIYHFYYMGGNQMYDSYLLTNPRIMQFEPDELDYEQSTISQINMSIAYENLQYTQGQQVNNADLDEFINGLFFSNPIQQYGGQTAGTGLGSSNNSTTPNVLSNILAALGGSSGSVSDAIAAAYRAISGASGGALSNFGNFSFGGLNPSTLAAQAVNAVVPGGVSSGVSTVASSLASALSTGNTNSLVNAASTVLPSAALGALNANSVGTAQYGYNSGPSSALNPASYASSLTSNISSAIDSGLQWF